MTEHPAHTLRQAADKLDKPEHCSCSATYCDVMNWVLPPDIAKPLAKFLRAEANLHSEIYLTRFDALDLARAILHTEGTNDK